MENKKMDKKFIDESILNITRTLGKANTQIDADSKKTLETN
jgi:hypothetical protein